MVYNYLSKGFDIFWRKAADVSIKPLHCPAFISSFMGLFILDFHRSVSEKNSSDTDKDISIIP